MLTSLRPVSLAILCTLGATSALASPAKVKKAEFLQGMYESGDQASLVEALALMEDAIEHPKVATDPNAVALLGHLRLEAAKGASDIDGFTSAARDLSRAMRFGATGETREQTMLDLRSVLGTL